MQNVPIHSIAVDAVEKLPIKLSWDIELREMVQFLLAIASVFPDWATSGVSLKPFSPTKMVAAAAVVNIASINPISC